MKHSMRTIIQDLRDILAMRMLLWAMRIAGSPELKRIIGVSSLGVFEADESRREKTQEHHP